MFACVKILLMNKGNTAGTENRLTPYLSPAGAWAVTLGTSIGWGSLVVTSNTYLLQAGPFGSAIGTILGAIIMLVIGRNYHYMINCYPDAGGAYAYSKHAFSYDHGFITGWFLALTYLAVFWANASSLPLFARYFLGDIFRFGFHYTVFGYEVYFGEALLSIVAIILTALLLSRSRILTSKLMIVMALVFTAGITICFAAAIFRLGGSGRGFDPAFIPDKSILSQVIRIACISPWAFIGFENISHASEEYTFPHRKAFRILAITVITTTLLYIFVTMLSATAYPPGYASWLEYIQDRDNLSGINGLPAFYAAYYYMGRTGIIILMLSLLALIISSLIGNTLALSRLFYAFAKDDVLPQRFAKINDRNIPQNAVILIACISLFIPFIGRTAIGWIVDVTTLGATIIYGFVSAAAMKTARDRGDSIEKVTGLIGLVIMVGFGAMVLLPTLFTDEKMATESYILFTAWAIFGFIVFRWILQRDANRRFGKSIVVWIALLSLVLFSALVWMSQATLVSTTDALQNMQQYYIGSETSPEKIQETADLMNSQLAALRAHNARILVTVIVMFIIGLAAMLNNYSLMMKKARETEEALGAFMNIANKDPLTGVKSKHAYAENEKKLDEQIREGTVSELAVVVCDVNGLKHINDTLGHKAGDEYICQASELICKLFSHSPVFRIGGDEFAVILTGSDYQSRAAILKTFNERVDSNIASGDVIVSAGISEFEKGTDESIHAVFKRADQLMYERKKELKAMGARTR